MTTTRPTAHKRVCNLVDRTAPLPRDDEAVLIRARAALGLPTRLFGAARSASCRKRYAAIPMRPKR